MQTTIASTTASNNFHLLCKRQIVSTPNLKHHFTTQSMQRLGIASMLASHTGCVNTINWNDQGTKLVSAGDDCTIKIWHHPTVPHCKPTTIQTNHTGNIFCALFVPQTNDTQVLTCAADSDINVLDVTTKKCTSIREHTGMVHKLAVLDSNVFLSCSRDGTCREFDLRQQAKDHIVHVDLRDPEVIELESVAMHPLDANYFIVGGGDCFVRLYDRRKPAACVKQVAPLHVQKKCKRQNDGIQYPIHITSACYNHDGSRALASYSGDAIYELDMTYEPVQNENVLQSDTEEDTVTVRSYQGHRNVRTVKEVKYMGASSDFVMSGSDCGHLFIWSAKTGHILNILAADKHIINCIAPIPTHDPIFATSGIEYDVKMWWPTCQQHATYKSDMSQLDQIKTENEESMRSGHNMLQLPAEMVFNLLQMMRHQQGVMPNADNDDDNVASDEDDDDTDETDQSHQARLQRECAIQ